MIRKTLGLFAGLLIAGAAYADAPKIAVTDLAYEEKVSQYFHVVAASEKSSIRASESHRERDSDYSSSASGRSSVSGKHESNYFEAEGTYTYIDRGELRNGEDVVRITERERDILNMLARAGGEPVQRQALAGGNAENERTIDVQINRLRRKIEQDATHALLLQTVRGVGYRLMIDR